MEHHEYASLFPMLPDAELQALAEDIKANGLQTPITTLDDKILDGRNRHRACEIAGVFPNYQRFVGKDPLAFVISHNLHRRHLDESQRAVIAKKLTNMKPGRPSGENPPKGGVSTADAAEMLNTSVRSVQRAARVLENGSTDLQKAVEDGDIPLTPAEVVSRLPKEEQDALVEQGPDAVKAKAKEIREGKHSSPPPGPPPTTKRVVVPKIGIGMDRAERAIRWLEEISDEDPQRAEALTHVIGWCQEQLNKTA